MGPGNNVTGLNLMYTIRIFLKEVNRKKSGYLTKILNCAINVRFNKVARSLLAERETFVQLISIMNRYESARPLLGSL